MSAGSYSGVGAPVVRPQKTKPSRISRKSGARTLTKRDLVLQIADAMDLPQETVQGVVQRFLDGITEGLYDGLHIEFRDFGVFEIAVRKSRIGRNPNRPENTVAIPERRVVKFKPGKRMKNLVARD